MLDKSTIEKYYDDNKKSYSDFLLRIKDMTENSLKSEKIEYAKIEHRIKDKDKFYEKCIKKEYCDLKKQFTDFAGFRIITKSLKEVNDVCKFLESEFEIDFENSEDKAKLLESNKVGYLSVHYIASFKKSHLQSTENKEFADLKVEIQVRTLLQHAWSEMTHDTIYHKSTNIDIKLSRDVNLIAGLLEVADNKILELNNIIAETQNNADNNSWDIEINDISLNVYMKTKFNYRWILSDFRNCREIIEELSKCKYKLISDIDKAIKDPYIKFLLDNKNMDLFNFDKIIRNIMIIDNVKNYFSNVTKPIISKSSKQIYKNFGIDIEKYI
ncbi:MAG: hypothetical protein LBT30_04030 [Clostridiales bacterium]|jgi:ppGpp synthetase/RelA/SpoT-type nucleotidyltranferase|nr:hypothetical protein [Clostridiales bacterium]